MADARGEDCGDLSRRERQVAALYIEGRSYKEIARALDVAPSTVRTHLNTIYRKLAVTSRTELLHRLSGKWSGLQITIDNEQAEAPVLGRRLRLIHAVLDGRFDATSTSAVLRQLDFFGGDRAETAPTQFAMVNGHRIAYRRVGRCEAGEVPLVLLNRFRGSMDDWDPALVNAAARDRQVILFDNSGVGESEGKAPASLGRAADDAVGFFRTLGFRTVDLLGWSLGGMIAQIVAVNYPDIVRRLALVATLPPGGFPDVIMPSGRWEVVARQARLSEEDLLYLFFSQSPGGVAAGRASLDRISARRRATEIKTGAATMHAQYQAARLFFRDEEGWCRKVRSINSPTLVVGGDNDPAFPVIDSVVLARAIPDSQLALYPDAGHGALFQYPHRFAADLRTFLCC